MTSTSNDKQDKVWLPTTGALDIVDRLSLGYVPATKYPSATQAHVQGDPYHNTSPPYTYPEVSEQAHGKCGQCRYYVEGGSCALVKGAIDPINGTCKFWEGGTPLDIGTPVFPVYEQPEANYWKEPYEPHLSETFPFLDKKILREGDQGSGRKALGKAVSAVSKHTPLAVSQGLNVASSLGLFTELNLQKEKYTRHNAGSKLGGQFAKSDGSQGAPKEKGLSIFESVAIPSSLSAVDIGAVKTKYQDRERTKELTGAENDQLYTGDNYPDDTQHKKNYVATGSKLDSQPSMTNEEGHLKQHSSKLQGLENYKGVFFEPPMQEIKQVNVPAQTLSRYGKYTRTAHEFDDICATFEGKIFDLNNKAGRPVPPSEGLGYTTTHPNCKCYWTPMPPDYAGKGIDMTAVEKKHVQPIRRKIAQRARRGKLHTVFQDGKLSTRTRKSNPLKEAILIRETVAELASEFRWVDDEYRQKLATIFPQVGGQFFLIRASSETITDHRADPMVKEPYRRKLDGMELHALTRTGIGKGTDINHLGKHFQTEGMVLDAEYDLDLKESQMLVHESDPEILRAIERGDISEVSINAGTPRKMSIECSSEECFVVPRGLVLGETDGIAFTWVVTNPNGFIWRGQQIEKAKAGVQGTKIERL